MENLANTLKRINDLNIITKEDLMTNTLLYEEIFLNIDDFILSIVFRSHLNINYLHDLQNLGVDKEDVHMDCLVRCISKIDLVLNKNLDGQIPYLYTICNNIIIDHLRKAITDNNSTVSLNETLNSNHSMDSNKSKNIEDYLIDPKPSSESMNNAKETIIEFYKKHCGNADILICALASKVFQDKPTELASILISTGSVSKALSVYQKELEIVYGISLDELPLVAPEKTNGLTKILNKSCKTPHEVSSKISNIINRTM